MRKYRAYNALTREILSAVASEGSRMNRIVCPTLVVALLAAPIFAGQSATDGKPPTDENKVWPLEDTYWRYVQADDLEHYRTLWHKNFLGWPLSTPEPVRRDHITDWITAHTSAGETLKSYELERLAAQATGDDVTLAYRVHMTWIGNDGVAKPTILRVIHTWRRGAGGKWQIISGMAAPPNAQGH
jgi:ketosteroid isomerase-like protein